VIDDGWRLPSFLDLIFDNNRGKEQEWGACSLQISLNGHLGS
jgi:hypothetical protein